MSTVSSTSYMTTDTELTVTSDCIETDCESDSEYQSTVEVSRSRTTIITSSDGTTTETTTERSFDAYSSVTEKSEMETTGSEQRIEVTSITPRTMTKNISIGTDDTRIAHERRPYDGGCVDGRERSRDQSYRFKQVNLTPTVGVDMHYPLLLRINPKQKVVETRLKGIRLSQPIVAIHMEQASTKHTAQLRLVPSLEADVLCAATIPSFMQLRATVQFIASPPTQKVEALIAPAKQKITGHVMPRNTGRPQLMMAPQGPLQSETLTPLWETVTYTVSSGKHVAVQFKIPTLPVHKIKYYKAQPRQLKQVDAKTLYRKNDPQPIESWKAEQMHQLELSTVEKSDPQMVRIVRLEQNPALFLSSTYSSSNPAVKVPSYHKTTDLSFANAEQAEDVNTAMIGQSPTKAKQQKKDSVKDKESKKKKPRTKRVADEPILVNKWQAPPENN